MAAGLAALVVAMVLLVGDCTDRSNGNEPAQGQEWLRLAEPALFTSPPAGADAHLSPGEPGL